MSAIDMTEIYKKYRGLWVALVNENEVVAAGEDGKKVYEEARAKGIQVPRLFMFLRVLIFTLDQGGYEIYL